MKKINFRSRQYSKEEWFVNFAGEQCEYDVFWPDPTNHKLILFGLFAYWENPKKMLCRLFSLPSLVSLV